MTVAVAFMASRALGQDATVIPIPPPPDSAAAENPAGDGSEGGFRHGRWTIIPYIEVREAVTDNAFLTPTNREWDAITTFSPGVSVRGEGGRLRFNFDYTLNYDLYARHSDLSGFRQNFTGFGTAELLRRSVYIDIAGYAGQDNQTTLGPSSAIDRRLATNDTQTYSYSISPYWVARYGPWATSTLRYRFAQFFDVDNSAVDNPLAIQTIGNSTSNDVTASIVSGEYFNQVTWDVQGAFRNSATEGGSTFRSYNVDVNGAYHINRTYALLGSVGWQSVENTTFIRDLNEFTWNVGLAYTPHERLSANVRVGERYGDMFWSGEIAYQIGPRTRFVANYNETITTQQQQAIEGLAFIARDPVTDALVDSRTGQAFTGRDARFDQSNRAFRQRQFQAALHATRGRNTFNLTGTWTERDDDVAEITNSNFRERSLSGSFVYTRAVSRMTDAYASVYYSRTTNNMGGEDDTFRAGASVRWRLNRTLSAGGGYAFISRSVEGPQLINQFARSFHENVVYVSLRKAF